MHHQKRLMTITQISGGWLFDLELSTNLPVKGKMAKDLKKVA